MCHSPQTPLHFGPTTCQLLEPSGQDMSNFTREVDLWKSASIALLKSQRVVRSTPTRDAQSRLR
jgi:hypothetical protein